MAISSTDCRARVAGRAGLVPRPRRCGAVHRQARSVPNTDGGVAAVTAGEPEVPRPSAPMPEPPRPPFPSTDNPGPPDVVDQALTDHTGDLDAVAGPRPGAARHRATDPRAGDLPTTADRSLTALLAGIVVVLVLLGAALIWVAHNPFGSRAAAPAPPTQQTVLTLLTDTHQHVLAGALLGTGTTGGVCVMVPSTLVLDLPGGAQSELAEVLSNSSDAPAGLLGRGLGVPLDGSWMLTTDGLARLVDVVGGITIDAGAGGGVGGVVNQAPMSGAQAAALAAALAPGEPQENRLARFSAVLIGTLGRLAEDQADVSQQLAQTGSGSTSTLSQQHLAQVLVALHRLAVGRDIESSLLPLRTITAAGRTEIGLDPVAARGVVSRQVSGQRLPLDTGIVRVLVEDGIGVPGLVEAAGQRLAAQGLESVGTRNAGTFGQARTTVLLASASAVDRARGLRVAAALGVRAATVRVNAAAVRGVRDTGAQVVVVLGADFRAVATARP